MENKTQTLMHTIIRAYAQHKAWCEDDIELRVRLVGSQWDTWIAGLGAAEGECFPSPTCSFSAEAESLEASLLLLASLLVDESKEQFEALASLHKLTEVSRG